ncbi:MAG: helix-turn-helix domain-containing protein [Rhodospirillales bacterium]|nr:helix-turn-helix domain-containing protein [Rhodospirillales bacterium]
MAYLKLPPVARTGRAGSVPASMPAGRPLTMAPPTPGTADERDGDRAAASATTAARTGGELPRLLTIAQVAAVFGRQPRTVRAWIAARKIRAIRIGRTPFVSMEVIEKLISCGNEPDISDDSDG